MIKNGKNDFDIWQEALAKIDMNEAVAPIVRGRVLLEESEVEMYNKILKLLNSTGMESAHQFLYSLDPCDLTESECAKVNNLWNLGVSKGFIQDEEKETDEEEDTEQLNECDFSAEPVNDVPTPMPVATPSIPLSQTAFTVVYSAMRDGQIKTGEAYSNCINTRSAKADVISKLERAGYQNISILAIEAGDPDAAGCDNTYCALKNIDIPDYSEDMCDEADDGNPVSHALDPFGIKASSANLKNQNSVQMTINEDDAKAEVKKAFDAANKEFGDNEIEKDKTRKWLDDNKDKLDKIRASLNPEDTKKLDIITKALDAFTKGKLEEDEEVDEAAKPSTGIKTLVRGLLKVLCTLVSLSGSAVGLTGKLVTWAGKLLTVGADKVNLMIKDSETDTQVNEEDEDKESKDEKSDDEGSKDDDSNDEEDSGTDDSSDAEKSDEDNSKDSEDSKEDKKEENAEEPDEKLKDDKEDDDSDADKDEDKDEEDEDKEDDEDDKKLSAEEKTTLKDSYKKAFKAAMQKCKFETSFSELSLEDKVKFFTALSKAWGDKADPSKFMTDKEIDQLEKIVVKK